ncbi:hypothetical protein AN1V17_47420 [Vallitalea sediminicola]
MSFGGLILTNKGRNLQVKAQTGIALTYTNVKIGDGEIGSGSILDMNDLKNSLHVLNISNIRRNGNQVTIRTIVTNKELQEGFYFREIGVFAEDPDEGEILYCYANARSNAEYIPAAGTDIVEKNIDVVVIVGQAENVTATIDESLIFASKKDVESKVSKVEGKGLSDENYSTEEKDKLAGIEEGAEVNRVISDSISIDSSETAASSKAVKQVNDKVNNRVVKVNGRGLSTEDYSSGEKNKLAGIEEGAEVNREISDRVDLDSSSTVASSKAVKQISTALADIANVIVARGTGIAIRLSMPSVTAYTANMKLTFIASHDNSSGATTIDINNLGAKNLYKPNTTTAPNIKSGKFYTVWYNGTHFFLQASAEGNALAEHVLAGRTFSNDDDNDIVGIMNLSNLIPSNIRNGVNINGIIGTIEPIRIFTKQTTQTYSYTGRHLTIRVDTPFKPKVIKFCSDFWNLESKCFAIWMYNSQMSPLDLEFYIEYNSGSYFGSQAKNISSTGFDWHLSIGATSRGPYNVTFTSIVYG